jgi:3-phenylpropionate/cinnamic acid dioxygenase small subunit
MTDVRQEQATVTRTEVEDFLYYEAALLDEWRPASRRS